MQFKSNFFNYIKPYLSTVCVLFAMLMLLKIGESIFFLQEKIKISAYFKAFFYYGSVFSLYSLILFPLYVVFRLINKKLAIIASSLLFASFFLLELGLSVYSWYQGHFLGVELLLRPFAESSAAMLNTISLPWIILIVVGFLAVFVTLSFLLSEKVKTNKIVSISFARLIIVFAGLSFLTPKITFAADETAAKLYATAKNSFFFQECLTYQKAQNEDLELKFEPGIVNEFLADHPDWIVPDKIYPLEREDNIQNTLGEYFPQSDTAPNIVYIICESLCRGINLPQEDEISFTPFLDSLAQQSLYWQNCVSISERTFGVIPATTGSLPVGNKGFQFGEMPKHNTIFTILKSNNYQTNVFHSEVAYYDSKQEYFLANKVDFYPNFYGEWSKTWNEVDGRAWWGYHDSILLAKTMKEIGKLPTDKPLFNLIITITTHDAIESDNPLFATAFSKTENIYKKINSASDINQETKEYYQRKKELAASFVYLDMCLEKFFAYYSQRADFKNTIFVITGDHSTDIRRNSEIKHYHVPLIIYSPQLTRHKQFEAVVSHNDITPTIVALLRDNYKLRTPKYVQWVGTNLDTTSGFKSSQKQVFLSYSQGPHRFLYNNLFYCEENSFILNSKFELTGLHDQKQINKLKRKFQAYKYVHEYVYKNNKLTAYPVASLQADSLICEKEFLEEFQIVFTDTSIYNSTLFFDTIIEGKYKEIKVSLTADVKYHEVYDEKNVELSFECTGDGMKSNSYTMEGLERYFGNGVVEANTFYSLENTKIFDVDNVDNIRVIVKFFLCEHRPPHKSTWRNLKITVEGMR